MKQLSTADAAARLGVNPKTLYLWRKSGDGPPFVQLGRKGSKRPTYRYPEEMLEAWNADRTRNRSGSMVAEIPLEKMGDFLRGELTELVFRPKGEPASEFTPAFTVTVGKDG
jgi:hypothetical protein